MVQHLQWVNLKVFVYRCCGDTAEKNQRLWVPTPDCTTGSLRTTSWVSEAFVKDAEQWSIRLGFKWKVVSITQDLLDYLVWQCSILKRFTNREILIAMNSLKRHLNLFFEGKLTEQVDSKTSAEVERLVFTIVFCPVFSSLKFALAIFQPQASANTYFYAR